MVEPTALTPEERDALAAELALGVLDGGERAAALRLQADDAAFAADVANWQAWLAPLQDEIAPQQPSDALWRAIERRIAERSSGPQRLTAANDNAGFWRLAAFGSGALAAGLAAILVLRPVPAALPPTPAAPTEFAVVQVPGDEGGHSLVARYEPVAGQLRLRASGFEHAQMVPELWVIPADGKPRSLGGIAADGMTMVPVSTELRAFITDGATIAVTMEPAEGMPHAAPSSAPVAAGKLTMI